MSMRDLEMSIVAEARIVSEDMSLKLKDLMEWSTTPVKLQEGEVGYYLPVLKVYTAFKEQPKPKVKVNKKN